MTVAAPSPRGFAANLARRWTSFYTLGLTEPARTRRLLEIESDLWEHWNDLQGDPGQQYHFTIHTIDRVVRGALADLLWRFHAEGFHMQLEIPINRIAGLLLILLIGAILLSISAAGYDTSREGFASELTRLAEVTGWQATVYTALQAIAGLGMVAAAVVFYLQLRGIALTLSLFAAAGLCVAGILTLVGSTLYLTAAEIADQWALAPATEDAALVTARALLIALAAFAPITIVALVIGVEALAVACARNQLVPRWLGFVAALAACILVAYLAVGWVSEVLAWLLPVATLLLLMLWLAVAGSVLLFGAAAGSPTPRYDGRSPTPQP